MCLGIPGRVIEVKGEQARVDVAGTTREASIMLLDDVRVGEYVIIHAGFAIHKVDEKEAAETLKLLGEIVEGMPKV